MQLSLWGYLQIAIRKYYIIANFTICMNMVIMSIFFKILWNTKNISIELCRRILKSTSLIALCKKPMMLHTLTRKNVMSLKFRNLYISSKQGYSVWDLVKYSTILIFNQLCYFLRHCILENVVQVHQNSNILNISRFWVITETFTKICKYFAIYKQFVYNTDS